MTRKLRIKCIILDSRQAHLINLENAKIFSSRKQELLKYFSIFFYRLSFFFQLWSNIANMSYIHIYKYYWLFFSDFFRSFLIFSDFFRFFQKKFLNIFIFFLHFFQHFSTFENVFYYSIFFHYYFYASTGLTFKSCFHVKSLFMIG